MSTPRSTEIITLQTLTDSAREFAALSRSENTKKAYRSQWGLFASWCSSRGMTSLPTSGDTLALYITDLARLGRKPASIDQALAAIAEAHKAAGHASPRDTAAVRAVRRGIRKTFGTEQKQARAIAPEELREISVTKRTETTEVRAARDRALLLLGFSAALRRSELIALNVGDLEFCTEGIKIKIRKSKTDQEGQGRTVGVPRGKSRVTCPVRAIEAWLAVSGLHRGALFRAVTKGGRLKDRLTADSVVRVIRWAAQDAGLETEGLSGHSLRSGLVTAAAAAGVQERVIMRQTGHKSEKMVRRYIREGSIWIENAAIGLL